MMKIMNSWLLAARHDQMWRTRAKSCARFSRSLSRAPNLPKFPVHVFSSLNWTNSFSDFCPVGGAPLDPRFEQPFRIQTSNASHGCGIEAGPSNSCQFQRPFPAHYLTTIVMPVRSHVSTRQQTEESETHISIETDEYGVSICQNIVLRNIVRCLILNHTTGRKQDGNCHEGGAVGWGRQPAHTTWGKSGGAFPPPKNSKSKH